MHVWPCLYVNKASDVKAKARGAKAKAKAKGLTLKAKAKVKAKKFWSYSQGLRSLVISIINLKHLRNNP
jgi:hypothetical protein